MSGGGIMNNIASSLNVGPLNIRKNVHQISKDKENARVWMPGEKYLSEKTLKDQLKRQVKSGDHKAKKVLRDMNSNDLFIRAGFHKGGAPGGFNDQNLHATVQIGKTTYHAQVQKKGNLKFVTNKA